MQKFEGDENKMNIDTENKEIKPVVEPTAEERANVKSLLEALGL